MDSSLKKGLERSTLTDIPGLVEHLFPDNILPLSVDTLLDHLPDTILLRASNDRKKDTWAREDNSFTSHKHHAVDTEMKLASFLNKIIAALLCVCREHKVKVPSHERTWTTVWSKVSSRPPDMALVDGPSALWSTIFSSIRVKSKRQAKPLTQLIHDAFMAFYCQGDRRFYVGATISSFYVRVYVFDRAGYLGSTKFNLLKKPRLLIRLLAGLALTSYSASGIDPTFIYQGTQKCVDVCGKRYEIVESLFTSDVIRGRGTVCWRARRNGVEYVIKDAWVDISRSPSEATLMREASGVEGVPILVDWEVVSNPFDKYDSTAYIRSCIDRETYEYPMNMWLSKLEIREHRRIVSTPCAIGVKHFSTKRELLSVFIDAIKAHRGLVERGVLHRDISLENIMMYSSPLNPQLPPTVRKGLLIDLDNATFMSEEDGRGATGLKMGTLPFIATDLLEEIEEHQPRHDLESFFYVLLWICWQYAGPNNAERKGFDIRKTIIETWTGDDPFDVLGEAKSDVFGSEESFEQLMDLVAPYFAPLKPFLRDWRAIVFKEEVIHEDVIAILRKALECLPDEEIWSPQDDRRGYGIADE